MSRFIYRDHKIIGYWLMLCWLLVACMVVVGGYTRLSGSGLSITQWKPIHGVVPPLNEKEWLEEFEAYQESPQYIKVNKGMSIDEFRAIYWPEYFHRLLGRSIGIVAFVPLIIFIVRRSLTPPFAVRLAGIFILGGIQGLVGWIMVASGLVSHPYVNHVKLATHLGLAFIIMALLLWAWLDVVSPQKRQLMMNANKLTSGFRASAISLRWWFLLLFLQILYGAFLAGMHGGLIYNTFPTMNGDWVPSDILRLEPMTRNLFENISFIQFTHRWLAIAVAVGFIVWWAANATRIRGAHLGGICRLIMLIILVQITLGVLTLINAVPLHLALSHQFMAMVLFGSAVVLMHRIHSLQHIRDVVWRT